MSQAPTPLSVHSCLSLAVLLALVQLFFLWLTLTLQLLSICSFLEADDQDGLG